ncbi:MAG: class II aldolase/adducin family protein [Deltaproteobacteria bacterium]|nr:class II aldolase/adducin family protein [Deltaproteobacteria bacterium]
MGPYTLYQEKIIECTRWLSLNGFFGSLRGTGGNVSMRVPGEEAFIVTPSTLPYDQLTLEEMCVLDFNKKRIEGKRKPSVESGLHLKVYQCRPDVNAVIHSHQNYASVFAVLNKPIPSLFDEVSLHLGPVIDVIPYALSGSPELTANIGEKLDNGCHGYLLQNHGALTLGSTLEEAWLNVELLEKIAKIYLGALSTGGQPTLLPDDTVNLLKELRKKKLKKA